MKIFFACFFIGCFFFVSCENQPLKTNSDYLPALSGNKFILTTDRVAQHPDVQFPRDTLTESDYVPMEIQKEYNVVFSADGIEVTISDSISGTRIAYGPECSKFDITDDLFAGGRFLVWKDEDHYEAEYTIYGSGVPVVRSERGELRKSDE